jgi:hypothetical protein
MTDQPPSPREVLADELRGGYRAADKLLDTLRSRGYVVLSREQIHTLGDICDVCTHDLTGVICPGCRCDKGAANPGGGGKG